MPLNRHLRAKTEQAQSVALDVPEAFDKFALLCRIRSGTSIIRFNLYDWQFELSRLLDIHKKAVIFKTRQLGATETLACKMLHKACRSPAYAAAVLSMGGEETGEIARRVREMPSRIPNFKFSSEAVTNLQVEGGGFIKFRPSTNNSVRSLPSIQTLLFDEAAFVPNQSEIYAGAVPSQEMVGADAETWVVSTMSQEGKLSWFWNDMFGANNGNVDVEEKLRKAREGIEPFSYWIDTSGWLKVIVHWKCHPIYGLIPDYLEKTRREKKLTEDKLQREYNLGIPESGGSLFQHDLIAKCAVGSWQAPKAKRKYLAGLDPNFGGSDFFTLQVWDVTEKPYQLVKQYRSNSGATVAYHEAFARVILNQYRPVVTAVEINTGGKIVLENLIRVCPDLRFAGVLTSGNSKAVNTDRIAVALESLDVAYPSDWEGCCTHTLPTGEAIAGELYNFSAVTRKATIGNDDTVMSWAVAFSRLEEALKG
jgi:hypothetical protein